MGCSCDGEKGISKEKLEDKLNKYIRNFDDSGIDFKTDSERKNNLEMKFQPKESKIKSKAKLTESAGWKSKLIYNNNINNSTRKY